ncbi:hypothetical protein [Botrimarina mediterranea]|uniref:hypothetical protein n=1 Tax=Botrimarina mediterranea TaxID=2528022 RepID=UPI00118C703E|nr:hypothetical protein K2D_29900 [Planctomycetes bacterium K2D]
MNRFCNWAHAAVLRTTLALVAAFGLVGITQAQVTPIEQALIDSEAEVTGLVETAATQATSMMTIVVGGAIVLLVFGIGIAFLWKFFSAGRTRA